MLLEKIHNYDTNKNINTTDSNKQRLMQLFLKSNKIPEKDKNAYREELNNMEVKKSKEINEAIIPIKQELNYLMKQIKDNLPDKESKNLSENIDYSNKDHLVKETQQALLKIMQKQQDKEVN